MIQGKKNILFSLVALVAIILRLVPHAPNLALMGALAVGAGYYLKGPSRYIIAFAAIIISDLLIGPYSWPIMMSVYLSYLIFIQAGVLFSRWNKFLIAPLSATVLGSISFFIITNFAVWVWSGMYRHDPAGLLACYTNALPFFRNSFLSDIYGTTVLVGLMSLMANINRVWQRQPFNTGQTNTEHV